MSKNAVLLFLLVNMTLLTINLTPSKIFMFVILLILVLIGYKKVFNFRSITFVKQLNITCHHLALCFLIIIGLSASKFTEKNSLNYLIRNLLCNGRVFII